MREIKFRGKRKNKRKDINEWVYGPYYQQEHNGELLHLIHDDLFSLCRVDPDTVGQHTNKKDKEGKEIYEDDIVYAKLNHSKYIVRFGEYDCGAMCENPTLHQGWYIERLSDGKQETLGLSDKYLKKIGNKHDNSELL